MVNGVNELLAGRFAGKKLTSILDLWWGGTGFSI